MIDKAILRWKKAKIVPALNLGTPGYLAVFVWCVSVVMLTPAEWIPLAALICLLAAWLVFPLSGRKLLRARWLVMLILLALPPVFYLGETDRSIWGIPISSEGLLLSAQIATRMVVILVALQGMTTSVDIASLAGLLERFGLQGLGFSLGVALNLLPSLQQSAINAWHSLWMRGGLRRQRWHGLRLLVLTILSNTLRRAEDIALAAETRAFSPERARPLPIKNGKADRVVILLGSATLLGLIFVVKIR